MNLFYLNENPSICAQDHCDKHVVKMIVEYAQLLSTAHRLLDGEMYHEISKNNRKIKRWKLNDSREESLYKATHMNHPSNKWARETSGNYEYLWSLFDALLDEYTHRYGKIHATSKLRDELKSLPKNIKHARMTKVPQAMPEYCQQSDSIQAYKTYYNLEKTKLLKYTNRPIPTWVKLNSIS